MLWMMGDMHGDIDLDILLKAECTSNDIIIILGDFGLDIAYKNNWLDILKLLNFQICFVDGNHDHHPYLSTLPTIKWNDGIVGVVHDNIYHLRRGEVYNINNETFFCMGGGGSIDKAYRTEGLDWWKEELPSYSDWANAEINLTRYNNKIDYVLAHTMPYETVRVYMLDNMYGKQIEDENAVILEKEFENLIKTIEFKHWFCGHWHPDNIWNYEKYTCIYRNIIAHET